MLFNNIEALEQEAESEMSSIGEKRAEAVRAQFVAQFNNPAPLLMITKMHRYNVPIVVRAKITPETIEGLLQGDRTLKGLPKFMADFLDLKPSRHRETLALRPELIVMSADNQYLILPNPSVMNHEKLIENPKLVKTEPKGFGLIAWFIHPNLLNQSKFLQKDKILKDVVDKGESLRYGKYGNKDNLSNHAHQHSLKRIHSFSELDVRDVNKQTVDEIVSASKVPYLSGPFDYNITHLESLKALKTQIINHLLDVYGVNDKDKVDLYFHTHYSVSTTTMHCHIRINQLHHGLELDRSITLGAIIECLENNRSVSDLFIERGIIHSELAARPFLEATGYKVKEIENPYFIDEVKLTLKMR